MRAKPLSKIKVLDLTHRLPGPLAGHLLKRAGAQVTKIEDTTFGDPFLKGLFEEMDSSFFNWYEELNEGKEILRIDFKGDSIEETLHDRIKESDIVLMGLPLKLQKKFKITFEDLKESYKEKAIIEMTASHERQIGLHDLNIMAEKGLLKLHMATQSGEKWIAPPFLPIAGIGYGSLLAMGALGTLLKARQNKTLEREIYSLEEAVDDLYGPFFSPTLQESGQTSFLHNGRYPCYALYPLRDKGFLAVACLEEKYWKRFIEAMNLKLSNEDRFQHSSDRVFKLIYSAAKEMSFQEAQAIFGKIDACVTPTR